MGQKNFEVFGRFGALGTSYCMRKQHYTFPQLGNLLSFYRSFKDDPRARIFFITCSYTNESVRDLREIEDGFSKAASRFFITTARKTGAHILAPIAREAKGLISWRTGEPVREHFHSLALFIWKDKNKIPRWPVMDPAQGLVRDDLIWKYGSEQFGKYVQLWDYDPKAALYAYGPDLNDGTIDHYHRVERGPTPYLPKWCPTHKGTGKCELCGLFEAYTPP
jgi:hypothetical protein